MDNFLTSTCTHKHNPTGAAILTEAATGIVCSPPDPVSATPSQDYPIEKLFLLREFFTKYAGFQPGDYATFSEVDYPIRAVHPWAALGGLDDFYRVMIEITYVSEVSFGKLDFYNVNQSAYEVVM